LAGEFAAQVLKSNLMLAPDGLQVFDDLEQKKRTETL